MHLFAPADAVRWRYGSGNCGGRDTTFSNPPHGAAIYYSLKDEDKGEIKIEILDAKNTVDPDPQQHGARADGQRRQRGPEDFRNRRCRARPACSARCGICDTKARAKSRGGKIDTGDPADGPRVAAGHYTVRLTAAGKTLTAPLQGRARSARRSARRRTWQAQATFAVRVRDDISKVTDMVNQLRSVRDQLKARNTALESRKNEAADRDADQRVRGRDRKDEALEDKLHNPTAEVVYDILAMRGGARLYSRLASSRCRPSDAAGAPTAGMTKVLAEQEKELEGLGSETHEFLAGDVAKINQRAAQLNVPFVIVK